MRSNGTKKATIFSVPAWIRLVHQFVIPIKNCSMSTTNLEDFKPFLPFNHYATNMLLIFILLMLKASCLPYAVGKQPSIPLINLGKMDVKMMMMIDFNANEWQVISFDKKFAFNYGISVTVA